MSESAREAAERNAQAVMAGNFMQLMADITPEALAGLMQMGAAAGAGAFSITSMPAITGYTLGESTVLTDAELIPATFESALGTITMVVTWKQIMGAWKIAGLTVNNISPAAGA